MIAAEWLVDIETLRFRRVADAPSMEYQLTEDEQAIRKVIETWMRASQSGDTATVLSLMTEDAVFTVAGREPFGREAFEAAAGATNAAQIAGTNEIVELQVLGDWAFTRNRIDLTVTHSQVSGPTFLGRASRQRGGREASNPFIQDR